MLEVHGVECNLMQQNSTKDTESFFNTITCDKMQDVRQSGGLLVVECAQLLWIV
jgi:hypothetical protein